MSLKLTGGQARGRLLPEAVPNGVRPSSARLREALFSMVGHDLEGVRVLDAFGGTGLISLEAWSRGAQVVVVEQNREALKRLQRNLEHFQADEQVRLVQGDVLRVAAELGRFDLVFADPPYALPTAPILDVLCTVADDWLVLESDAAVAVKTPQGFELDRRKEYGGSVLWMFRAFGSR